MNLKEIEDTLRKRNRGKAGTGIKIWIFTFQGHKKMIFYFFLNSYEAKSTASQGREKINYFFSKTFRDRYGTERKKRESNTYN